MNDLQIIKVGLEFGLSIGIGIGLSFGIGNGIIKKLWPQQ